VTEPELSAAPGPPSLGRKVILVALLAVCVFALLSVVGDVRALGRSLARFQLSALGSALLLVLCNYALRFLRWQYYLRRLGVQVEAGLSALVFLSGFIMSVTPGKMGEIFKSYLLQRYRGIALERTVSAVVAERLLDLVALVVLVSWAGAAFPDGRWVAASGAILVLGIVVACTVRPFGDWVLGQLARVALLARFVPKLQHAYAALYTLTRPAPFGVGACLALMGWFLECAAALYLVRGFGDQLMSLAGASYAYAAGTLAGALAMLPGGLGVAEIGMSGLFRVANPVLPLSVAAAITILVRLCTLWFGVALGGIALALLRSLADEYDGPRRD
jgi:glycosyltransferase 2 family protein